MIRVYLLVVMYSDDTSEPSSFSYSCIQMIRGANATISDSLTFIIKVLSDDDGKLFI